MYMYMYNYPHPLHPPPTAPPCNEYPPMSRRCRSRPRSRPRRPGCSTRSLLRSVADDVYCRMLCKLCLLFGCYCSHLTVMFMFMFMCCIIIVINIISSSSTSSIK